MKGEKQTVLREGTTQLVSAGRENSDETCLDNQLKAQLLTLALRLDEADTAHKSALAAAPDDFDANMTYAYFLRSGKRGDEAKLRTLRCLELAKESGSTSRTAESWLHLAMIHRDQKHTKEAGPAYEEALKIYRDLAAQDPNAYLPELAAALNNLATFHQEQNNLGEAGNAHAEALKIYRGLADQNPDAYRPSVAMTLNSLAAFSARRTAEKRLGNPWRRPLKYTGPWRSQNPERYQPYVA